MRAAHHQPRRQRGPAEAQAALRNLNNFQQEWVRLALIHSTSDVTLEARDAGQAHMAALLSLAKKRSPTDDSAPVN